MWHSFLLPEDVTLTPDTLRRHFSAVCPLSPFLIFFWWNIFSVSLIYTFSGREMFTSPRFSVKSIPRINFWRVMMQFPCSYLQNCQWKMVNIRWQRREKNIFFLDIKFFLQFFNFNYCSHFKPFTIGNLFFCSITKCPIIAAALCFVPWNIKQILTLRKSFLNSYNVGTLKRWYLLRPFINVVKCIKSASSTLIITLEWHGDPLIIMILLLSCGNKVKTIH